MFILLECYATIIIVLIFLGICIRKDMIYSLMKTELMGSMYVCILVCENQSVLIVLSITQTLSWPVWNDYSLTVVFIHFDLWSAISIIKRVI